MDPLDLLEPRLRAGTIAHLAQVEQRLRAVTGSTDPLAERTGRHLLDAGGKRFRPLLTLLVADAVGSDDGAADGSDGGSDDGSDDGDDRGDRRVAAACAVELLHLSTLYHDDVIDGAATRRGVSSANARWGERLAVLAGDRLTALAMTASADAGGEVPALVARTYRRLVEGERREAHLVGRTDGGIAGYLDVVDGKTASLIAGAARAGAAVAGASASVRDGIEDWGRTVGVAFQVADDLLDLTATPASAGKPVGRDLEVGVYTWPILAAIGTPSGPRLRTVLQGPPPLTRRAVEEAMEIVHACGAVARAGRLVARLLDRADGHLTVLPPGAARDGLRALARTLVPPAVAAHRPRLPEAASV